MSKKRELDIVFIQLHDGEWATVTDFDQCCDCGLVHEIKYRVVNEKIERKVWRRPRVTSKVRETPKIKRRIAKLQRT